MNFGFTGLKEYVDAPSSLALEVRARDPTTCSFDPSICNVGAYGAITSPNGAMLYTIHVEMAWNDKQLVRHAVVSAFPIQSPFNTILQKAKNSPCVYVHDLGKWFS